MVVFFLLVQTIPRTRWFWVEKQTSVISKKPLLFLLSKQGLKGLGITQIYSIANQRAQEAGRPGQPRIDVDISWMVRKYYPRLSVPRAIDALISVFGKLRSMGFSVTLVFDPRSRHHTKKASIRRTHNREWARADAVKVKIALMNVSRQLKSCPDEEQTGLLQEQKVLLKKNRAAETLLSNSLLPDDFMDRLRDELNNNPQTRDVMCITGEFQADSCLARRMIHQETDVLLANDSDLPCLVGRPCLIIKDFRMNKQSDLFDIEIASGFLITINNVASYLGIPENHPSLKRAIFPLFDGVEDARARYICEKEIQAARIPSSVWSQIQQPAEKSSYLLLASIGGECEEVVHFKGY
jgi:hypothetical protein